MLLDDAGLMRDFSAQAMRAGWTVCDRQPNLGDFTSRVDTHRINSLAFQRNSTVNFDHPVKTKTLG